jgi:hypothetical protein
MNTYRVQLNTHDVELLAPNASTALITAQELYPDHEVLSVMLEPEWADDDHPSLTAAERNPNLR